MANQEITRILNLKPRWRDQPQYTTFNEDKLRRCIDDVYGALCACWGHQNEFDTKRGISHKTVDRAFRDYRSKELEPAEYTFLVPKKIERLEGKTPTDGCISELDLHMPIYSQRHGIDANIAQRGVVGMPPVILSHKNASPVANQRDIIVCSPLETSMLADYVSSPNKAINALQQAKLMRDLQKNIQTSMKFIKKMGCRVVGLGATLLTPALTNFGQRIKTSGVTTTTGHGGTVHLVAETVTASVAHLGKRSRSTIGIIGAAGLIGSSTLAVIRKRMPEFDIVAYDVRQLNLRKIHQPTTRQSPHSRRFRRD